MAQPFYSRSVELNIGPKKGETVYYAQAFYYGTISTKQVAAQIAQESALTPADVLAVLERLAYFCQAHASLGYRIKIDGMGTFFNELLTVGSVSSEEEVTAKLVKSIRPSFKPEYTRIGRKNTRYALLPEKVELVKIDFKNFIKSGADSGTTDGGDTPPSGGDDGGDTGSTGGDDTVE